MNRKGFIATSLIYSFFLVFLTLMLSIITNRISGSQILSAYNSKVKKYLDSKSNALSIVIIREDDDIYIGSEGKNIINTYFHVYYADSVSCIAKNEESLDPGISIESTEELTTAGLYTITCTAENNSGERVSADIRINVRE